MIISGFASSQNLTSNSTGSFTFNPESPIDRPSVEVFYHIPSGDLSSMPILFSFHGASRNADDYRDYWIDMANQNGFMVFSPEFSTWNYPGLGDNLMMGTILRKTNLMLLQIGPSLLLNLYLISSSLIFLANKKLTMLGGILAVRNFYTVLHYLFKTAV